MRKKPDGRSIEHEILRWYRTNRRDLPWRGTKDPYRIWVSEVMLQQTTVPAVLPYYKKWLRLFPDVGALANAPLDNVLKAWEGLGYYARARNLHQAAKVICREHGGRVPDAYETLIGLPGFGPYITAAVLSIAHGLPFPVIDANVRRVMMRLFGLRGRLGVRVDRQLLERLGSIIPARRPGDFNQALMDLGALVCRPRNPGCLSCPVQMRCLAFKRGEQEVIPAPAERDFKRIETVVGIINRGKRYLIQRRPDGGLLGGLWEFPGGKREKGETLRDALRREIREELGAEVINERRLLKVRHAYTSFRVTLHAFECELAGPPKLGRTRHRWTSLKDMKRYPFPSGSAKIVHFLEETERKREGRGGG